MEASLDYKLRRLSHKTKQNPTKSIFSAMWEFMKTNGLLSKPVSMLSGSTSLQPHELQRGLRTARKVAQKICR